MRSSPTSSRDPKKSRRTLLSWSLAAALAALFTLAMPGRSLAGPGSGNEPPDAGRIVGHVAAGDRPAPGAHVALINAAGVVVQRTQTNDRGEFAFREVRPGRWLVRAEKRDVGAGQTPVLVRPGEIARARILLRHM